MIPFGCGFIQIGIISGLHLKHGHPNYRGTNNKTRTPRNESRPGNNKREMLQNRSMVNLHIFLIPMQFFCGWCDTGTPTNDKYEYYGNQIGFESSAVNPSVWLH
jgi:SRSO17 transposase